MNQDLHVEVPLVRRLVASQFPEWADLPIRPVDADGRDNDVFRLGGDLCVRLSRRALGARHLTTECRWLPVLAPHLTLPVPVPVGRGVPSAEYPLPWSVTRWLPGRTAALEPVRDEIGAADELARFIAALRAVDPTGGPASELRGVPLRERDAAVRAAIAGATDRDRAGLTEVWDSALTAPPWTGARGWNHGDLHPANLLVVDGRLTAVIDFGLLGVGDPDVDLAVAWTALSRRAREHFRASSGTDDATWRRARGRALDFGLMCSAHADPLTITAQVGRRTVDEVLADEPRPTASRLP
ncbi:aminoglycoside phosphotransferase family protein [Micromonospora siamensis]|uniref:Predicted kinase, aminoglycoside phosphotransferase (APT) family n=1 Tax=Micromonospora siamensis TaxID=299152 RepID=A0A1C5JA12_9ACTN|nr:aminoglycoside phosphotransferase family protein [Micromonospora siamensis]SCG67373.1 Predicted kinase, aminoglycoside phosphotransferase (APT) family [Micromonospora siamensis]